MTSISTYIPLEPTVHVTEEMLRVFDNYISETIGIRGDATTSVEPATVQEEPEVIAEEVTPSVPVVSYPSFNGTAPSDLVERSTTPVPENSGSILINEATSRFSGAIWYEKIQEQTVLLAGVGGIGSFVAFLLSRMHPARLVIYDDDTIELANMSGQLYSVEYIGQSKVDAIGSIISKFSDFYSINTYSRRFDSSCTPSPIMICGFDNMAARKMFYESWKRFVTSLPSDSDREKCLFIDGRLAAEEFQVFCITGNDTFSMARYESEWLFSDDEADATVCSYKQTTYMANMIGSVIVNLFTNFCANLCDPIIPRDLPFFTSYDASLMYFKTEI